MAAALRILGLIVTKIKLHPLAPSFSRTLSVLLLALLVGPHVLRLFSSRLQNRAQALTNQSIDERCAFNHLSGTNPFGFQKASTAFQPTALQVRLPVTPAPPPAGSSYGRNDLITKGCNVGESTLPRAACVGVAFHWSLPIPHWNGIRPWAVSVQQLPSCLPGPCSCTYPEAPAKRKPAQSSLLAGSPGQFGANAVLA